MVAVAETANSQGKGKQAGSSVSVSLKTSGDLCGKLKTTLKTLVCSLVSLSMVLGFPEYGIACPCPNYHRQIST